MKFGRNHNSILTSAAFIAAALIFAAETALSKRFGVLSQYGNYVAAAEFIIVAILVAVVFIRYALSKKESVDAVIGLAQKLNPADRQSINGFPLPLTVSDIHGNVLWYNGLFYDSVLKGEKPGSDSVGQFINGADINEIIEGSGVSVTYKDKAYTVYASSFKAEKETLQVLYFVDDTYLKNISSEYALSRPVVLHIAVDGTEEVGKGYKNSEIAEIRTDIERIIEEWSSEFNCLLKQLSADRFMMVTESRYLDLMKRRKFAVLDTVRAYKFEGKETGLTLSIGVGQGDSFEECEATARQSLDMSFGRGGDQATIRNKDASYEFFGGVAKSVEKKTKVRSRIVASAIGELITESKNVIIMGHRFPDMDSFGSAIALCRAARAMGTDAEIVADKATSLAKPLYERLLEENITDMVVEPDEGKKMTDEDTLLIIVDTHIKNFVEVPEIYEKAGRVVVIDHHRKAVNFIDDAVVFYHDPGASSAAEMVTELLQYMTDIPLIGRLEADALLAGIMLDTKNFILRAGVRTFEAAAYLRERGADTVKVKKMFSTSIENHKLRNQIISDAVNYKNCAISCADFKCEDIRVICSQGADELLNISDVDASFVIYESGNMINISARSLGKINVQIIMEKLGGGGHQTMAAAQFKYTSREEVLVELKNAIKEFYES